MEDNYFGELEYSEQLDWYSCTLDIDSVPVFLSISAEKGKIDLEKAKALILGATYGVRFDFRTFVAIIPAWPVDFASITLPLSITSSSAATLAIRSSSTIATVIASI